MAENICLMLTEATTTSALVRVLSLAAAAVDLHKRTVLYVGGRWIDLPGQAILNNVSAIIKGPTKYL